MKYKEMFTEPQLFTDSTYVIGGWYTREKAAELIAHEIGEHVDPEDLEEDLTRFGFAPEFVEGCEDFGGPVWFTGAKGVGSKRVWTFKY